MEIESIACTLERTLKSYGNTWLQFSSSQTYTCVSLNLKNHGKCLLFPNYKVLSLLLSPTQLGKDKACGSKARFSLQQIIKIIIKQSITMRNYSTLVVLYICAKRVKQITKHISMNKNATKHQRTFEYSFDNFVLYFTGIICSVRHY